MLRFQFDLSPLGLDNIITQAQASSAACPVSLETKLILLSNPLSPHYRFRFYHMGNRILLPVQRDC